MNTFDPSPNLYIKTLEIPLSFLCSYPFLSHCLSLEVTTVLNFMFINCLPHTHTHTRVYIFNHMCKILFKNYCSILLFLSLQKFYALIVP